MKSENRHCMKPSPPERSLHQLSCDLLSALANFPAVGINAEMCYTTSALQCFQIAELLPPVARGKSGDLLLGESVCERNMWPLSAVGGSVALGESFIVAAWFLLSECDLDSSPESVLWGLNIVKLTCTHCSLTFGAVKLATRQ